MRNEENGREGKEVRTYVERYTVCYWQSYLLFVRDLSGDFNKFPFLLIFFSILLHIAYCFVNIFFSLLELILVRCLFYFMILFWKDHLFIEFTIPCTIYNMIFSYAIFVFTSSSLLISSLLYLLLSGS